MKGDFTRSTFKQEKHYSSVRMQQGRVQLDADWNEQLDITAYRHATESADVVGLCGTPKENAGFSLQPQNDDFLISSGRCYVDGIMCENDNDVLFTEQGDFPEITQPPNEGAGFYLAYLDVWQRHITVLEDSEIREVALGGPDTATRIKTIWQVKLAKLDGQNLPADPCAQQFKEWDNIISDRDTRLAARAEPDPASSDPCIVPPGAGFRRLENQLYRVEMHTSGKIGTAKFKWSRDNGSIASAVETIEGNTITIRQPARDALRAFTPGQWVEITDEVHELQGKPGTLARLAAPTDGTSMTIEPTTVVGDNVDLTNFPLDRKPKVRRWDHVTTEAEIVTSTDWLPLEDGVQVQFDGTDEYQTGDYWLIPARTATADIEWPLDDSNNPLAQKQHGIKHHYCRLAILELNNGWNVIEDCRKPFPALTALTASDVTYDPSACPDLNQKGVKTVQEAIDQLCQMEGGGCAVTVGVGGQYGRLNEAIEDLLPNQPDICICLLPGDHELPEGLSVVNKPDGPAINLKIVGCAHGTRIKLEKNPFNFKLLSSVAIRDVEIDSGSVLNPFRIDQCGEVALTSCYLTGVTDRSVLVTIGGANRIRIEDNVIEALKKTSFRSPEDVFKSVDPELSKLFTMMNRKSFNRSAAASAQRLAKLKSAERKSLATKVQKSMRAFGNRLSLSEQQSYNNFVRNLSASKVNPNLLIASIKGIRGVTAQISSGTAMVIEDANADTIIENNEIVGVVSFYGTPSKTKLTQQDLKNLAATLKQRGATISDSIGTLQVQKNRLSRLVISEELILQIKSIVAAGKGSIENVFKSVFFTANSIGGGENQFVGQHIAMTSNSFGIVGKDVGTAVAESAVFVGNHAPNDVRLFNVTRESEKTANLTINIVDS